MKIVTALAGAFLAAVLLLFIVDIYTPDQTIIDLPLLIIFFIVWSVGFGYATIEANLKKKIVAVLIIEGIALTGMAGYYIIARDFNQYIFHFTVGVLVIILMFFLKDKKS
ncbi:MAG: hypothetical protein J7K40_13400 [candidate division Zixibacteria bacterium]|nr:hypothetical protein [candidate division Zixibacteria bacterium]